MQRIPLTWVLVVCLGGMLLILSLTAASWRLPGDQQGYEPAQPIAFSHHLHAGELQIGCLYCHHGAEDSAVAGIPALEVCMNCHRYVTAPLALLRAEDQAAQEAQRSPQVVISAELQKLYDALGLDEKLQPDPERTPQPIVWTRVHDLPDFVAFNHAAHVRAGVTCQHCHGPVETMERVRQYSSLSMGWCVNCHREATRDGVNGRRVTASIDCVTCHY